MLHFRHFLISALMVGAALTLPDSAFAEKNEPNGEPNPQKELVQAQNPSEKTENVVKQANVPVKADQVKADQAKPENMKINAKPENAKINEKPAVVPERASQSQSALKPPVSHSVPQQAAAQKAAASVKSLPEQANGNGYGLSNSKVTEGTVTAPSQAKSAAVQESKEELAVTKQTPADRVEPISELVTVENKTTSTRLVYQVKPQGQASDVEKLKEVDYSEPQVTVPPEKEKAPSSKEEIPTTDQVLNPTQRSNSSGSGPSNDRGSQSLMTISFLGKWFEWNKYYDIKLAQPYLSRYALRNHQWVNAPPSPPPQKAPFLKTVTCSY